MSNLPEAVAEIVAMNGGTLIGKTRLQKTAYLLESFELGFGFDFDYHYYGPYSEDLSVATDDAEEMDLISAEPQISQDGYEYVIFSSRKRPHIDPTLQRRRAAVIETLDRYDTVTLELAATADFLAQNGYSDDPWAETRRRKKSKATPAVISKAQRLLAELRALNRK